MRYGPQNQKCPWISFRKRSKRSCFDASHKNHPGVSYYIHVLPYRSNLLWIHGVINGRGASKAAFTTDAMRFLGAARLHVKLMQRRGQTRIRSDGAHDAVRLRRQLKRQIRMTRSRSSQSAVRLSACRH